MSKKIWNRPKYTQSLENRVYFWLSLGVFWSFSEVSRVYWLFLRFQWYFWVFLAIFCLFSRILGCFGHSWCILVILAVLKGLFQRFWCIYLFVDILVILISKIYFFSKKIPQKSLYWPLYPEMTKIPWKQKITKTKTPWNLLIHENSH